MMVDAATSVFRLGCDAVDLLQLAASQASVPPPPRDAKHGEPLGRQTQARRSLIRHNNILDRSTANSKACDRQLGMLCTYERPERTLGCNRMQALALLALWSSRPYRDARAMRLSA